MVILCWLMARKTVLYSVIKGSVPITAIVFDSIISTESRVKAEFGLSITSVFSYVTIS